MELPSGPWGFLWALGASFGRLGLPLGAWGFLWALGASFGPLGLPLGAWGFPRALGASFGHLGFPSGTWGRSRALGAPFGHLGLHCTRRAVIYRCCVREGDSRDARRARREWKSTRVLVTTVQEEIIVLHSRRSSICNGNGQRGISISMQW